MARLTKNVGCQYIPELTRPNAIAPGYIFELQGYWQSYLHFTKFGDNIQERIFAATHSTIAKVSELFIDIYKKKFTLTPKFSFDNCSSFKKQLAQSNLITWVRIHVRRLDFISLQLSSSDEYLFSAIKYYTSYYLNVHFMVTTDDKPYCRNLFRDGPNITLTPETFSMGDDLITLSLCEHSIVTTGTFG
ncbi:unnamed protein product, partial [Rotaria magnacalcarata]